MRDYEIVIHKKFKKKSFVCRAYSYDEAAFIARQKTKKRFSIKRTKQTKDVEITTSGIEKSFKGKKREYEVKHKNIPFKIKAKSYEDAILKVVSKLMKNKETDLISAYDIEIKEN